MKILAINTSPRKGGNTDILIDKALRGAREEGAKIEKVYVNDLKIKPCQECAVVRKDGICRVKDDFQGLFKKIMACDGLIIGTPVFFGSVSAQAKIMIDRFQCHWLYQNVFTKKGANFPRRRPAALLTVQATRRKEFSANAIRALRNFLAAARFAPAAEICAKGVERKKEILKRKKYLDSARGAGKKLARKALT